MNGVDTRFTTDKHFGFEEDFIGKFSKIEDQNILLY